MFEFDLMISFFHSHKWSDVSGQFYEIQTLFYLFFYSILYLCFGPWHPKTSIVIVLFFSLTESYIYPADRN